MKGSDIVEFAGQFLGRPYRFGAIVPKNENNYKGPFDCAELVSYCIFQCYGFLYGCDTSDVSKAAKADAYTGYLDRDAHKLGIIIPVEQAARTPGAILVRPPVGSAIGHTALCKGHGDTREAHSTAKGTIDSVVDGRRWSYGVLLHGVEYTENAPVVTHAPAVVYRLKSPHMRHEYIGKIQNALKQLGYYRKDIDNDFGPATNDAVVAFQKFKGLTADGEVMPGGETSTALLL